MSRVLEKDGLNEESLVTVDVDAIIQNNADYASERRRIEKVKDDVKRKKMLQNLYFQFRKQADVISDNVLDAALLKDLDIAWETTGAKVAWTIKEINRIKRHGYVIKIIYPLVPTSLLIHRSLQREKQTGQTPALPGQIRQMSALAMENILQVIDHVDSIYIYDNSGNIKDQRVVVEVNNEWAYTREDATPGPGRKRNVTCDCSFLEDVPLAFAKVVRNILGEICNQCPTDQ